MLTSALVGLIVSRPKFQVASTPRSSHHPGISWRPYDAATDCPVQLHERHVTTSFLWAAAALDLPRASVSVPKGISSCRQSAGTCTPSTTRVSGSRISCSSSTCFISSCTISRTLQAVPKRRQPHCRVTEGAQATLIACTGSAPCNSDSGPGCMDTFVYRCLGGWVGEWIHSPPAMNPG
eukprot:366417-Chlamydomonas_euryale.AAC.8